MPHGIPSHDTFGRVLAALDPDAFERSFHAWVTNLAGTSAGKHVAIDGKAIRRSLDRASGFVESLHESVQHRFKVPAVTPTSIDG